VLSMTIGLACVLLILTDRATWQYSGGILTEVPPETNGPPGVPRTPWTREDPVVGLRRKSAGKH
jgi:hypothetical protein